MSIILSRYHFYNDETSKNVCAPWRNGPNRRNVHTVRVMDDTSLPRSFRRSPVGVISGGRVPTASARPLRSRTRDTDFRGLPQRVVTPQRHRTIRTRVPWPRESRDIFSVRRTPRGPRIDRCSSREPGARRTRSVDGRRGEGNTYGSPARSSPPRRRTVRRGPVTYSALDHANRFNSRVSVPGAYGRNYPELVGREDE